MFVRSGYLTSIRTQYIKFDTVVYFMLNVKTTPKSLKPVTFLHFIPKVAVPVTSVNENLIVNNSKPIHFGNLLLQWFISLHHVFLQWNLQL